MPTKTGQNPKTAKKRAPKKALPSGEIPLGYVFPTEKMAQAARRKALKERAYLDEIRRLSDLSTLKHPKRERQVNFELYESRKALTDILQKTSKKPESWTNNDAGNLLLLKRLVAQGKFSDFPKQKQYDGMAALGNLGELKA